jgi:hydroxymethylpyrimidine pyrophosphatase-like HAD family hydrolase
VRYFALVTDFDGVVASAGRPSPAAVAAIERLRRSGRRAILITGRRLPDLLEAFPQHDLFNCIVAENGGVFYDPRTRQQIPLGPPPPPALVHRLRELGVEPLDVGSTIVATWTPHHFAALQAIHELGLELQIVFNDQAVMILPPGVNKASGMAYALRRLGLSQHEAVGVGDSQNDHSFLLRSECAATVANAVPSIREIAATVASAENGDGLAELIDRLIATDLADLRGRTPRNLLALGRLPDGTPLTVPPYGLNILIAGPSGSGKSTMTAGLIERLIDMEYQLCIIDPEGDYGTLPDVITIGNQNHAVGVNEAAAILEDPKINLNVNLLGIRLMDRPEFFGMFLPVLQGMRARTGRPHWIVFDEAHHMLSSEWAPLPQTLPRSMGEIIFVTVHPEKLPPEVLSMIDVAIAVGPAPEQTMAAIATAIGRTLQWPEGLTGQVGAAVVWFPRTAEPPQAVEIIPGTAERIRHHRKYAEGNLRDRSFYFRGPNNRHNLRAHNLMMFAHIAEGIDEETWLFHLRRGDYSCWFRHCVKDSYLADQAEQIERRHDLHPDQTRRLLRRLIEARYSLPG